MKLEQFGDVLEHALINNTYGIKSTARYMLYPRTKDEVEAFLKYQKSENFPFFIIGNGSNIVLSDGEFEGVVVSLEKMQKIIYDGERVFVEAGVKLPFLGMDIIKHGLQGLEWAIGIPGTIGGAIYGNAEAYKVCTFEYLESVTFINPKLEVVTLKKEELSYAYRTSFFKENEGHIIISATFHFPLGDEKESLRIIQDRKERRLASQPLEYPSAGSVFRNPIEDPAGKIIEENGLKGCRVGGAVVSEKHANFIVNDNNATGKDIRDLIQLVSKTVKNNTGIDLILEQEYKDW